jgi:hypothetical protein
MREIRSRTWITSILLTAVAQLAGAAESAGLVISNDV